MGTWRSEAHDQVGQEEPPEGGRPATPWMESPLCTFLQNKRKHISRKRKKGLRRPHRKSCPRNRHTHALPCPPRKPLQLKPDAWELGLSVGEITDHGATQMHAPPLPAPVTLVESPHVPSRDQLLAPSTLPHVLSLFTMPLSFTAHKDVHTWSSCSGKQMKPRKTLIFQKLQPGWEPACSVPGGRQ